MKILSRIAEDFITSFIKQLLSNMLQKIWRQKLIKHLSSEEESWFLHI